MLSLDRFSFNIARCDAVHRPHQCRHEPSLCCPHKVPGRGCGGVSGSGGCLRNERVFAVLDGAHGTDVAKGNAPVTTKAAVLPCSDEVDLPHLAYTRPNHVWACGRRRSSCTPRAAHGAQTCPGRHGLAHGHHYFTHSAEPDKKEIKTACGHRGHRLKTPCRADGRRAGLRRHSLQRRQKLPPVFYNDCLQHTLHT